MSEYFDLLELRSADQREAEQLEALRNLATFAIEHSPAVAQQLDGIDVSTLVAVSDLTRVPILRKSDLGLRQAEAPPFGGFATRQPSHFRNIFMSPGPIFEPGSDQRDWWRLGRFLHAAGLRMGDIIQNCFSYHLTPAGHMFESGVAAISATVVPAGTGQTELQVQAAKAAGVTAYAGTPDYLKSILEKADDLDVPLQITKAAVSGGALFPSLRSYYGDRGISCLQCYATADLGLIAYETSAMDGMVLDEGVIVEIVRPGTADPVPEGEVGEVVVTVLNADYPLIRLATGDLSAIMPGQSPCGRTNTRIRGWMGRADQTAKVKGMFVRPEQVAALAQRHPDAGRIRIEVTRANEQDVLTVLADGADVDLGAVEGSLPEILKLRGQVKRVEPGSLPNDGKVIDDKRDYD